MTHDCLGQYAYYRDDVRGRTDSDIKHALVNPVWFNRKLPNHRLWMRLLHQEAHKRGIKL